MQDKHLPEACAILKAVEVELDSAIWRKARQAAPLLHGSDRLDSRCRLPRLRKRDRDWLLELDRDLAALTNAFRNVSGARARIEQFHEWLDGGDKQQPLPFPRVVA